MQSLTLAGMTVILLGILAALLFAFGGWEFVFEKFHTVFFPMGNWTFPSNYLLINLYPEEFFLEISLAIFRRMLIVAMLVLGMSLGTSTALSPHER